MSLSDWFTLFTIVSGLFISAITTVGIVVWWLSRQILGVKDSVEAKLDKLEENILTKLEYHERHDDTRFEDIRKNVWEIKVRNAAHDRRNNHTPRN